MSVILPRVKDMPKPPAEPHRIVGCNRCKEGCYRTKSGDAQIIQYSHFEFVCTRCYYKATPELLDAMMESMIQQNREQAS